MQDTFLEFANISRWYLTFKVILKFKMGLVCILLFCILFFYISFFSLRFCKLFSPQIVYPRTLNWKDSNSFDSKILERRITMLHQGTREYCVTCIITNRWMYGACHYCELKNAIFNGMILKSIQWYRKLPSTKTK